MHGKIYSRYGVQNIAPCSILKSFYAYIKQFSELVTREHLLRVKCNRVVEHGQRPPDSDQPRTVHSMRPGGFETSQTSLSDRVERISTASTYMNGG